MPSASLRRRLAALFYDSLALFAVLFAATAVVLALDSNRILMTNAWLYRAYLMAASFLYFGWCWTHGGQTLGMCAWGLRVQTAQHQTLNWRQAVVRFVIGTIAGLSAGIGFWFAFWDKERCCLHDRLSATVIVRCR